MAKPVENPTNRTRGKLIRSIVMIMIISRLPIAHHSGNPRPLVGMSRIGVSTHDLSLLPHLTGTVYVSKKIPSPLKKSALLAQHCTGQRDGLDPPTLPKTGPTFARSLASQIANPSPNRLCAFPSTC